ncbi:MAG: glycosyltransferase family 4 protein [Mycobacteriales bacterium]|nr:MAG: alpha-(1-2)-phosphatidylinositol mannosyltransferase [Pseudonocardiales bacterium]
MRVGLVCPYTWDIPGGVQAHVRDLAETLLALGHHVRVLTPVDDETLLPSYAIAAGHAVPVRYNGSVARLQFGPVAATRVRRFLRDGRFDVLHLHEPVAPSVSLLACMLANGPIVATFHTSNPRSRSLSAAQGVLQPFLEKINGRIAVSPAARQVQVEHLGGDAVEIPNGVAVARFASATPLPGVAVSGGTIGFIGRYDEPRKGLATLLDALPRVALRHSGVRLAIAGRGDADTLLGGLTPKVRERVRMLGRVSESEKAGLLAAVDVYCAPNLGNESFGIVLLEAMAAGVPVVASDLPAFRRVLDVGHGGSAGRLFRTGDPADLAAALTDVLDDPGMRARLSAVGRGLVCAYDWPVVAAQIVRVYETVIAVAPRPVVAADDDVTPG